MWNVFPDNFTTKTTPVAWDKVMGYDSVSLENKNLTVDWIATTAFSDRTTDNLIEWTNEYYTEAKVTANTTVVWKADKTNVLELDNTTPFTPTADYHPVTKKYLDDSPYPTASETVAWIVEIATDTEVSTWTDTTRSITPKTLKDNYLQLIENKYIISSSNLKYSADTERVSTANNGYTKSKQIQIWIPWTISIEFDSKFSWTINPSFSLARIYINWAAVWTERNNQTTSYITYTEDISVRQWDLVQLYYSSNASSCTTTIRNFRLSYDLVLLVDWTVNLD